MWVFFLSIIAGLAKGFADRLQFHYNTFSPLRRINWLVSRLFKTKPLFFTEQFWNPELSWKNKWKNGDKEQGEKFKFSSSFLVWLTDGWHLTQFILVNSLVLAVVFYDPQINSGWLILDFLVFRILFFIGFKLSYK